jgi:hypothetical protein
MGYCYQFVETVGSSLQAFRDEKVEEIQLGAAAGHMMTL